MAESTFHLQIGFPLTVTTKILRAVNQRGGSAAASGSFKDISLHFSLQFFQVRFFK